MKFSPSHLDSVTFSHKYHANEKSASNATVNDCARGHVLCVFVKLSITAQLTDYCCTLKLREIL